MADIKKNPAASIRQLLMNHAKARGDDYNRILTRYAIERLLYRLSKTEAGDRYVLKGAMLFVTWPEHVFRPTGDVDFLGQGDPSPNAIEALFSQICEVEIPQDGIAFDPASIRIEPVREEDKYQGVQLKLVGNIGKTKIPVQVDIGFGDHVYPAPTRVKFPGILPGLPEAEVLAYPAETVIAEKFEAMLRFGLTNGRVKDFFDIWVAMQTFRLEMGALVEAVNGTLTRRETAIPDELPVGPHRGICREGERCWVVGRVLEAQSTNNPAALIRRGSGAVDKFLGTSHR